MASPDSKSLGSSITLLSSSLWWGFTPRILIPGSLQAQWMLFHAMQGLSVTQLLGTWKCPVKTSGKCTSVKIRCVLQQFPGSEDTPVEAMVAAQVSPAPGGAAGICPQIWRVQGYARAHSQCAAPSLGNSTSACPVCGESRDPCCHLEGGIPLLDLWLPELSVGAAGSALGGFYSFCDLTIHTFPLIIRFPFLGTIVPLCSDVNIWPWI